MQLLRIHEKHMCEQCCAFVVAKIQIAIMIGMDHSKRRPLHVGFHGSFRAVSANLLKSRRAFVHVPPQRFPLMRFPKVQYSVIIAIHYIRSHLDIFFQQMEWHPCRRGPNPKPLGARLVLAWIPEAPFPDPHFIMVSP